MSGDDDGDVVIPYCLVVLMLKAGPSTCEHAAVIE